MPKYIQPYENVILNKTAMVLRIFFTHWHLLIGTSDTIQKIHSSYSKVFFWYSSNTERISEDVNPRRAR